MKKIGNKIFFKNFFFKTFKIIKKIKKNQKIQKKSIKFKKVLDLVIQRPCTVQYFFLPGFHWPFKKINHFKLISK
jgi:hypothetical protein